MADEPVIDVVIPCRDYGDFLPAAVDSVLGQDGVITHVVVVDDASDVPVRREPGWPVERVRIIRRDAVGGYAAAVNEGLAAGTAEWVAFLDADDMWPADRSRLLYDAIAGADLAYGAQVVFEDGDTPELRLTLEQRTAIGEVPAGLLPGTVLVRRALFDRIGPLPQEQKVAAFIAWMVRARSAHPAAIEVAVPTPVLLRRAHATNMTRTRTEDFTDYIATVARHRATRRLS